MYVSWKMLFIVEQNPILYLVWPNIRLLTNWKNTSLVEDFVHQTPSKTRDFRSKQHGILIWKPCDWGEPSNLFSPEELAPQKPEPASQLFADDDEVTNLEGPGVKWSLSLRRFQRDWCWAMWNAWCHWDFQDVFAKHSKTGGLTWGSWGGMAGGELN